MKELQQLLPLRNEKIFMPVDTYSAAMKRLRYILQEFPNVYVGFSGGKDSGIAALFQDKDFTRAWVRSPAEAGFYKKGSESL